MGLPVSGCRGGQAEGGIIADGRERLTAPMTAARIGICGPVGLGKTALIEPLTPVLTRRGIDLPIITNDLVTEEDADRLRRSSLIDPGREAADPRHHGGGIA